MYVVHDILHDFVSFYFTDENTQGNTTVTRYRLPNGETNSVRLLLLGTHFFNSKNDLISGSDIKHCAGEQKNNKIIEKKLPAVFCRRNIYPGQYLA